jgi:hypothetical protein
MIFFDSRAVFFCHLRNPVAILQDHHTGKQHENIAIAHLNNQLSGLLVQTKSQCYKIVGDSVDQSSTNIVAGPIVRGRFVPAVLDRRTKRV